MRFTLSTPGSFALIILSSAMAVQSSISQESEQRTSISSRDITTDAKTITLNARQLTDHMTQAILEKDKNIIDILAHVGLTISNTLQRGIEGVFGTLSPPAQAAGTALGNVQKLTLVSDALGSMIADPGNGQLVAEKAKFVLCLL